MKVAKWTVFALMLACGGSLLLRLALPVAVALYGSWQAGEMGLDSAAIGVIGSADGPTAVFAASTGQSIVPTLLLFVALLAAWLVLRHKTRGK